MALAEIYLVTACVFAAFSGIILIQAYSAYRDTKHRRDLFSRRNMIGGSDQHREDVCSKGMAAIIIRMGMQQRANIKRSGFTAPMKFLYEKAARSYDALSVKAGLLRVISKDDHVVLKARLSVCVGGVGMVVGCLLSTELMVGLAGAGFFLGWQSVAWAYRQEIRARNQGLEKQLSEMIEVVSLGLRSGLSFDRSLEMYHDHFNTSLSRATSFAQKRWMTGLAIREVALRELADSYDSPLFTRLVGTIIRSLRFGSTLSSSLEASAVESRSIYKAKVEERVAKAPVKMLIPTGTLILPAMLILVLGPILLDLMQTL